MVCYTREEAIEMVGIAVITELDSINCEPTNRVGVNGACQGDRLTEWSACMSATTIPDGLDCEVAAYYYTTNEEDALMHDCGGDGSVIDWTINHYTIL